MTVKAVLSITGQIANWVSMPTVMVTGPTVMQKSPFSSLAVAVTIASTHFAYPRRDDQAQLAWLAWLKSGGSLDWWRFGLVVTSLGTSTKLLYIEPS